MKHYKIISLCLITTIFVWACGTGQEKKQVVVYTALDQMFSEPILQDFENATGIDVKEVYDTEASKTVGLVNRIIAEKDNPQCDVFWNNEIIRTIVLKKKGLLQKYISPESDTIPSGYKDPEGYWTGFAARARVIIYNKNIINSGCYTYSHLNPTRFLIDTEGIFIYD